MNKETTLNRVARIGLGYSGAGRYMPNDGLQTKSLTTGYKSDKKICDILSKEEYFKLARHLHNGSDSDEFGLAYTTSDGESDYCTAIKQEFDEELANTWNSITAPIEQPCSLTVYARSNDQMSTWACFDIDAHDDNQADHADWIVRKLTTIFKQRSPASNPQNPALLVENSGRGYHIWMITAEKHKVSQWKQVLECLLTEAEIDHKKDNVELYPAKSAVGLGPLLRLPGSANVKTRDPVTGWYHCSSVLMEIGLKKLINELPPLEYTKLDAARENKRKYKRNPSSFVLRKSDPTSRRLAEPKALADHVDAKKILEECSIIAPATRNGELCRLVGHGFYKFSKDQIWNLACIQYEEANPAPKTNIDGHKVDFENAYLGMLNKHMQCLSEQELALRERLVGEEQTAFIIARSFARYTQKCNRWDSDGRFPFSGLDLATRLGTSSATAYRVRTKLIELGVIKKVANSYPGATAQKYVWLL